MAFSFSTITDYFKNIADTISEVPQVKQTIQPITSIPKDTTPSAPVVQESVTSKKSFVSDNLSSALSSADKLKPLVTEAKAVRETQKQMIEANSATNSLVETNKVLTSISENTKTAAETANKALQNSALQDKISSIANASSAVMGMVSATQYTNQVKGTKIQYETQKKLIDTNITNTQTNMMEQYKDNMQQLDAIEVGKNVSITSEGVTASKLKGLEEMGEDFAMQNTQAKLQKAALDLDYSLKVASAKQSESNTYALGAINLGLIGYKYLPN
jgi:hypothetical protein